MLNFSAEDVYNRFSELRLGEDLLWCSVLIPYLFQNLNPKLTQKQVKSTLPKLADLKVLTPISKQIFQPADLTLAITEGVLPIISFGSCTISTGEDQGMQIGFVIGLNVNLVIHISERNEVENIQLTGMDGVQLSRLLFEIGLPTATNKERN